MTIPKNTNKAKVAIATAQNIRCYSLSNNFEGNPISDNPVAWVRKGTEKPILTSMTPNEFLANELYGEGHMHAKLSVAENRYTLHVHDNLWYEFYA